MDYTDKNKDLVKVPSTKELLFPERSDEIHNLLIKLKTWSESESKQFLLEFVLNKCQKINLQFSPMAVQNTIQSMSHKSVKLKLIPLLQGAKDISDLFSLKDFQ